MTDIFFQFLDEIYTPNLNEMLRLDKSSIKLHTNHKHFGLCGVTVKASELYELTRHLEKVKNKYYPKQKNLISHYVDILNTRDSFSDLAINQQKSKSIRDSLSALVRNSNYNIDYIFIDKHEFVLRYGKFDSAQRLVRISKIKSNMFPASPAKDYNLYLLSLKHLIKNYYDFLIRNGGKGIIIAEARGEREDTELRQAFNTLLKVSVGSIKPSELRSVLLDLFIVPKRQNYAGTQLADLMIYPIYDATIPSHNIRTDHFVHFEKDIKPKITNGFTHVIPS